MIIVDTLVVLGPVAAALLFGYVFVKARYKKAAPDEALIVFGRKQLMGKKVTDEEGQAEGFRIVHGGGTFIWMSRPLSGLLLTLATVSNGAGNFFRNVRTRSFQPTQMEHSILHHRADTGIVGQGFFDTDRYDSVVAMSADGETLTRRELAAVIAVDQQRDPGWVGLFMSMVELGALLRVFGYADRQGAQRIALSSIRTLYYDGRLPDGWSPHGRLGILGLFGTVFELTTALPDAPVVLVLGF